MAAVLSPEFCPGCQQPLQLDYKARHQARTTPVAIAFCSAILVVAFGVALIVFILLGNLIARLGIRREDSGLLWLFIYAVVIGVVMYCASKGLQQVLLLPKKTQARCIACGWSGVCCFREFFLGEALQEVLAKKPVPKNQEEPESVESADKEPNLFRSSNPTDDDFLPSSAMRQLDELRAQVRASIRKWLEQGINPSEIEDRLICMGHDPSDAIDQVSWVVRSMRRQAK